MATVTAEFNKFASHYVGGMDHPIKRLFGRSLDEFLAVKARWLARDLSRRPLGTKATANTLRLLDVGCGNGSFLHVLDTLDLRAEFYGCDVSEGMLESARCRWNGRRAVNWALSEQARVPYAAETFDIAIMCCVLHHVTLSVRMALVQEIHRILRPGGRLYVFEHNPWNPLTQLVVRTTEIDQGAILLSIPRVRCIAKQAGFRGIRSESLLLLPPRFHRLEPLERRLSWLPIGGQFVVVGGKESA